MGKRRRQQQQAMWVCTASLVQPASHPFYTRLNTVLESRQFDRFVEDCCRKFYASRRGRPSLAPGVYFRLLLIGYFEGIDSERGIAWRAADSLAIRCFLGTGLEQETPDHSTVSRTRRLIDVETHRLVFCWVLKLLAEQGLVKGNVIGIDATTLEANAAMRSIVRRDTGERYEEFLTRLAVESGIETPTREQLAKLDRKRPKKGSNEDWESPHDGDARITKMKDGRTHLAYKAEHAVDLETGAVVALTVQPADRGDTASMVTTLAEAGGTVTELAGQAAQADAVGPVAAVSEVGVERVVADKGYHSKQALEDLAGVGVRTVIAEPERKRQQWTGQSAAQAAVYANRRRLNTATAKALMRRRGEVVERSFAHLYDTGGMRRVHLRKRDNIAKRVLIHAAAFNLSLILRQILRVGTARQAADLFAALCFAFLRLTQATETALAVIRPRCPLTRPVRRRNQCRWLPSQNATLSTGC